VGPHEIKIYGKPCPERCDLCVTGACMLATIGPGYVATKNQRYLKDKPKSNEIRRVGLGSFEVTEGGITTNSTV
jgi:hypothetical protein